MRRAFRLVIIATALAVTSCSATFVDARVPADTQHRLWRSFYAGGLIGHAELDIRDVCASGRAREVRTGEDALTLALTIVTLGIYAPRRVVVTCGVEEPAP
ncbi:MAG: hypothetical protein OZ921_11110 [Sorangiineae bacterium]|nr:hypothetical protein [Polyangiaceae bacterium]MEB2323056.1 hypothetical protein [Sorangiineae bacterium]